ncbi:hypothetical protein HU200_031368 [Digitaria exilis]|uniref:DUF4378 domain-containing protein n=1 Tax=Digitaria exilis TaxID=1010633 RepID=A0A835EQ95_9POAL|nr:hypothetical protein HU200_031368 [Digitaria exilis]
MSSLAIVEKRPSPFPGGGCTGGVLLHLLDWHRRLARKRRLFSPRRLLPSSLRSSSSPRRLPCPPPSPPPPAALAPRHAADGPAPGVVARLMGLESWPTAPPRPQKQRKVEAPRPDDSAVVLVLPTSRSRRHPAPAAPAPTTARSHHGADLPARSPRRARLVDAAAAKLLESGARASERSRTRLALAYACSSPQHRKDGCHSGALLQGSGPGRMADDFLSRSESLLTPSTRVQAQQPPPVRPAETGCDSAAVSRRHEQQRSIDNAKVEASTSTVVLPRMDFADGNIGERSFAMDAKHNDSRVRNEVMRTCARVRSSAAAVQTGAERLRKRETPTRSDVSGSVNSGSLGDLMSPAGRDRARESSARRVTQSRSGPRREFMGSVPEQRSATRRDVNNRSGLASTSRISSNGSGPKRGSRKARDVVASNRDGRNAVSSSAKPVARALSRSNVSKSECASRPAHDPTNTRIAAPDTNHMETSPSVMATSEKYESSKLVKAGINELGLPDRIELTSSDKPSGKFSASDLQKLISALTNDMSTSISQSSNYSDASVPLSCNGNIDCIDQSCYIFSNDQSPDFQKCYQIEQDVYSSAASLNNEPNQPSPTSVLEASFSNDASSLGSPVEKNEVKDLFVSTENKMEELFNLESDMVNLATSIDTRKTNAEETLHDNVKLSCSQNYLAHDSKFLESRLLSIGVAETISSAELLLGSSLYPLIIEMLENTMDMFGGGDYSDLTEDKKYEHTNFLFDCIVESLDSKFCNYGKCGYKASLKLPFSLSKDLLKCQVLEDISNWKESSGTALRQVSVKEVDQVTARWDASQVEAFDISIAIENDILETLVGEFVLDLW